MYKGLYHLLKITVFSINCSLTLDQVFPLSMHHLTENISQALFEKKIGCGIFVNLQRTFDTVDHETFLAKLDHYGVSGVTISWFK